ncbi:MAG: SprT-like domain-containing protein [Verrucomicrobiota bacterium]|nr:SprT-like domain-containing protein [Verrucomicrobiota bacterium]
MLLYKQLDLFSSASPVAPPVIVAEKRGRDPSLEQRAQQLLHSLGATIASEVRVEWSSRLRSAAGRADYRRRLITLNPRLGAHGEAEIERTFLHELAHLLAQSRGGRRRVQAHGSAWKNACADLGIAGETRCHSLPFPVQRRARPYLYRCPRCARDFPRARRIRRAVACLACCRQFNRGRFDGKFRLRLVSSPAAA